MPVIVGEPDATFLGLLAEVMERYHKPLHDAGVRIGVILLADPDKGPAIVSKGHSVLARIKICNLKERLKKGYDAELEVDENAFEDLSEDSQMALIDHELSHIALKDYQYAVEHDAAGNPTETREIRCPTDDLNRPKLRTVHGDWQGSDGFERVVKRWGRSACEAISSKKIQKIIDRAEYEWLEQAGKELLDNPRFQQRTLLDQMNDDEREASHG